jgi:transposase
LHKMVDKEYIRKLHYVEGWSIRKISRQLPVSRPTIRKMLKDSGIPKYNLTKPRPSPVMDEFRPILQQWLFEDQSAPPKQRHTAVRMYERLRDEYGFTGAESTVRRVVSQLRKSVPECFIPLTAAPGEQFQVDFGQALAVINGVETKAHLFCMRLKHSHVPFVCAFPTERLEAFLEGHVLGFEYYGGVAREGLYDNAKTQVVKILEGPLREEHEWFSSLRSHYLFNSHFCRPRRGNEKGSVENLVKYVRQHVLVPVSSFDSWTELNEKLLQWCEREKQRNLPLWEEERLALRALPSARFCAARPQVAQVSRYSLVTVDRNRYSVPSDYVGQNLLAKAYVDRIDILSRDQVIASHKRHYGRGNTSLQLEHYLTALERKPHAVTHATVVRQLPEAFQRVKEQMERSSPMGYKDFMKVLLLMREYPLDKVHNAINAIGPHMANELSIRKHLENELLDNTTQIDNPVLSATPLITGTDTYRYDQLIRGVS